MPFTGLAKSHEVKYTKETKFCHGECQKEIPLSDFPKKPGRLCASCTAKKVNADYHKKKAEREMYF